MSRVGDRGHACGQHFRRQPIAIKQKPVIIVAQCFFTSYLESLNISKNLLFLLNFQGGESV